MQLILFGIVFLLVFIVTVSLSFFLNPFGVGSTIQILVILLGILLATIAGIVGIKYKKYSIICTICSILIYLFFKYTF